MLTVTQAAAILGKDPSAVRRMVQTGTLPAHRIGSRWLIDEAELERLAPGWAADAEGAIARTLAARGVALNAILTALSDYGVTVDLRQIAECLSRDTPAAIVALAAVADRLNREAKG
jgi:excisionase family DNA binding protein